MEIELRDGVAGSAPNLTACDQEPIHIPGSIQPHGLLLVADASTLTLIGGAGDMEVRLQSQWLGCALGQILRQDFAANLDSWPEGVVVPLKAIQGVSELFDAVGRRIANTFTVELEPAPVHTLSAAAVLARLETINHGFEQASDLRDLCGRAAIAFRGLTNFDHVMVYRFIDDGAGVVLAEDRNAVRASFLNHHFPASDIPMQARTLYVRNRVRLIPDVGYTPAPLVSGSSDLASLDMSDLALRSVSPVHIQYLKNMGVGASASVSIVRNGVLWGLIACHNRSPKYLSYDVRSACDALAGSLSRQIRAIDEAERYRERLRLRSLEDAVAVRLGVEASITDFFASTSVQLCEMLASDGFAVVQGDDLYSAGSCPEDVDIRAVSDWVQPLAIAEPYRTHELARQFPAAAAFQERASGLLATTMSTEPPTILMWFRAEQIEMVNWAGNPHKSLSPDPRAQLTPRASFEAWSQTVRGKSRPWTLLETESASRLMKTIFDARQNRRVRDLNRELTATIADNERLLLQKSFLIREISHRTRNSLQLVSSFLSLQARDVGDEVLSAQLGEARRRILAVALVHSRLNSDIRSEAVDLSRYLEDLCVDIRSSMDAAWTDHISLKLTPIIVSADKAVNIGLIFTELLINANKCAYGGLPGPIAIVLEQDCNRFRLIVADSGSGRVGSRQGFGSRMVVAIVKSLRGELVESSNAPGRRVMISAPIS